MKIETLKNKTVEKIIKHPILSGLVVWLLVPLILLAGGFVYTNLFNPPKELTFEQVFKQSPVDEKTEVCVKNESEWSSSYYPCSKDEHSKQKGVGVLEGLVWFVASYVFLLVVSVTFFFALSGGLQFSPLVFFFISPYLWIFIVWLISKWLKMKKKS